MNPLVTCRRVLTWLNVCRSVGWTDKIEKRKIILFTSTIVVLIIGTFVASVGYIIKFKTKNMGAFLYATLQLLGFTSIMNVIFVGFISRQKVMDIFDSLSRFYNTNATEERFAFLAIANNKSERAWDIFFKFLKYYLALIGIMSIASVALCWVLHGKLDTEYFLHPGRLYLPWDQHTLIGYIGEIIYSILCVGAFIICNGTYLIFFISICWHLEALSKMFQHSAQKLNEPDDDRNDKEYIGGLVLFQNEIKGFFLECIDLFKPLVMTQLICTTGYLAIAVFQIDVHSQNMSFNFIVLLVIACVATSNLFLCCYFGELATNSFLDIADCLQDIKWYDLPVGLQKYFILMIADAQRPLYFHGYGIAVLKLETFTKVTKINWQLIAMMEFVYSYYNACRALTSN